LLVDDEFGEGTMAQLPVGDVAATLTGIRNMLAAESAKARKTRRSMKGRREGRFVSMVFRLMSVWRMGAKRDVKLLT
jgi:hypothetical protein